MSLPVTWRTDDPCPVCGTGLDATDNSNGPNGQHCRLCGWSTTWQTGPDGGEA